MSGARPVRCTSRARTACRALSSAREDRTLPYVVLRQLRAQRVAIEPKHVRGLRLVAAGAVHHRRQQRTLDVGDHHVIDAVRLLAVKLAKILFQRFFDAAADLVAAVHAKGSFHAARASSTHEASVGAASTRRSPMAASPAKYRSTATTCSVELSNRFIRARNASPPTSLLVYQPRCLRAMRTPSISP